MKSGIYLFGRCVGFQSEPWSRNGKSGVNYTLGIAREYEDSWGNNQVDVTRVTIFDDDAARIQQLVNKHKDQHVQVQIVQTAKTGGRNGAWLSTFLPRGGTFELVPTTELKAAG